MSALDLPGSLVTAEWLKDNFDQPQLIVFDGSWHMPATKRDGHEEWRHEHIKNAVFFDFDRVICKPDCDLPHMMPDADLFTAEVQKLGLNVDSLVVIYDTLGMVTSTRVWWMLRAMGFENCAVLDGGLPAWHRAGYDVDIDTGVKPIRRGNFVAASLPNRVCNSPEVIAALDDASMAIVDARPAPRYLGEVEEPRPGLRRGHMPGATNLPFIDLFADGLLRPRDELQALLADHFAAEKHTICSCGSGVTACVIAFAAHLLGNDNVSVYDGSWSEWGLPGDLPVISEQR